MAWSQTDLDKLEKAMANGARVVSYADRRVEYRDLAEMKQVRDMIRAELGLVETGGISVQKLGHSKGIE